MILYPAKGRRWVQHNSEGVIFFRGSCKGMLFFPLSVSHGCQPYEAIQICSRKIAGTDLSSRVLTLDWHRGAVRVWPNWPGQYYNPPFPAFIQKHSCFPSRLPLQSPAPAAFSRCKFTPGFQHCGGWIWCL